jgi:6-phosphogluconolactonase
MTSLRAIVVAAPLMLQALAACSSESGSRKPGAPTASDPEAATEIDTEDDTEAGGSTATATASDVASSIETGTKSDAETSTDTDTSDDPKPPTTAYLYTESYDDASMQRYRIDLASGAATLLAPIGVGVGHTAIAATPSADFSRLLVGIQGGTATVDGFALAHDSGELTRTGSADAMGGPVFIALSPDGRFAYGANYNQGTVGVFALAADGSVTHVETVAAGVNPHSAAVHPNGKFLYVPNKGSDSVGIYAIDQDSGRLTAQTPFAMPVGSIPRIFRFHPGDATLAVLTGEGGSVHTLRVAAGGGLSLLDQYSLGTDAADVAFAAGGKRIYVTHRGADQVALLDVAVPAGTLTYRESFATGGGAPTCLALTPDERFLFVSNWNGASIAALPVTAATGRLGTPVLSTGIPKPYCLTLVPVSSSGLP